MKFGLVLILITSGLLAMDIEHPVIFGVNLADMKVPLAASVPLDVQQKFVEAIEKNGGFERLQQRVRYIRDLDPNHPDPKYDADIAKLVDEVHATLMKEVSSPAIRASLSRKQVETNIWQTYRGLIPFSFNWGSAAESQFPGHDGFMLKIYADRNKGLKEASENKINYFLTRPKSGEAPKAKKIGTLNSNGAKCLFAHPQNPVVRQLSAHFDKAGGLGDSAPAQLKTWVPRMTYHNYIHVAELSESGVTEFAKQVAAMQPQPSLIPSPMNSSDREFLNAFFGKRTDGLFAEAALFKKPEDKKKEVGKSKLISQAMSAPAWAFMVGDQNDTWAQSNKYICLTLPKKFRTPSVEIYAAPKMGTEKFWTGKDSNWPTAFRGMFGTPFDGDLPEAENKIAQADRLRDYETKLAGLGEIKNPLFNPLVSTGLGMAEWLMHRRPAATSEPRRSAEPNHR